MEGSFEKEKFTNWVKENRADAFKEFEEGIKKKDDGSFVNNEMNCINYMCENRLNFNFRQVFKRNDKGEIVEDSKKNDSSDEKQGLNQDKK